MSSQEVEGRSVPGPHMLQKSLRQLEAFVSGASSAGEEGWWGGVGRSGKDGTTSKSEGVQPSYDTPSAGHVVAHEAVVGKDTFMHEVHEAVGKNNQDTSGARFAGVLDEFVRMFHVKEREPELEKKVLKRVDILK